MRSVALIAVLAPTVLAGAARAAPAQWSSDYAGAEKLARRLGRPVLVFWHEENELPGALLKSTRDELLTSPEVRARAARFVCVDVEFKAGGGAEGGKDAAAVGKLGIAEHLPLGTPEKPATQGFVFADAGGTIHGRLPGKPRHGALPRMMDAVVRAFGPAPTGAEVRALEQKLARAKALRKPGERDRAQRLLREMVETGFRCESVLQAKVLLRRTGAAGAKVLALAEELAKTRRKSGPPGRGKGPSAARAPAAGPADPAHPPHTKTWRECAKCREALVKAMAFLKEKTGKVKWYDGWLGTFFCGFTFMMEGNSEKELDWCVTNTRRYMMEVSACQGMRGYRNWFVSMSMLVIAEYSLRNGLTPENRDALAWAHRYAVEQIDDTGGWFHHPRHGGKNYAGDISMIGCMYLAAFLEMAALGIDAEPGLTLARGYVEGISDGRTIGYGTPWKRGGLGSGGKNGLVLMGLYATGNENDPFARTLGQWLTEHPESPPSGHASNFHHFFGAGAGLHRMGPEHYARFAGLWLHRLIDCQKPDGSIGRLPHDCRPENVEAELKKVKESDKHDWITTGILAGLILMTEPGTFAGLPRKRPGSLSNRSAFDAGTKAFGKGEYGKARAYFAQVLPPGEAGELIPKARARLREIDALARERLAGLRKKEDDVVKAHAGREGTVEALAAYDATIADYDGYAKAFAGMPCVKETKARAARLKGKAFGMRLRVASGARSSRGSSRASASGGPAPVGKLRDPGAQEAWQGRLKARVVEVVKAGTRLRVSIAAFGGSVAVTHADAERLKARLASGAQVEMKWKQLARRDFRGMAVKLAASKGTPADHALAAFFLLCDNEAERAKEHLRKAGDEGATVRAAFENLGPP